MNAYITLDGYKYATPHKTWRPGIYPLVNSRILLDGTLDTTWGADTVIIFQGEIAADVTPASGYGAPTNLRASLKKRQHLDLTDHYGDTYDVVAIGPFAERGLSPKWDSAKNTIYFSVVLKGIET